MQTFWGFGYNISVTYIALAGYMVSKARLSIHRGEEKMKRKISSKILILTAALFLLGANIVGAEENKNFIPIAPFEKSNQAVTPENFFNQMFGNPINEARFIPFAVDLKEVGDVYQLEADLPGVKKEDINLQYANNYLTITTKREAAQEEKTPVNYFCQERRYGQLQRVFYIVNVARDKITAEFKEGVLKIVLPKKDATATTTNTIPIQ